MKINYSNFAKYFSIPCRQPTNRWLQWNKQFWFVRYIKCSMTKHIRDLCPKTHVHDLWNPHMSTNRILLGKLKCLLWINISHEKDTTRSKLPAEPTWGLYPVFLPYAAKYGSRCSARHHMGSLSSWPPWVVTPGPHFVATLLRACIKVKNTQRQNYRHHYAFILSWNVRIGTIEHRSWLEPEMGSSHRAPWIKKLTWLMVQIQ